MATDPTANLTFLPWVRQGVATAIMDPVETLGSTQHLIANVAVDLTITTLTSATPVPTVSVRLRGPADVQGIDKNQIVRMDPQPGSTDFEPSYFPCIEFDRPDFPWLFTPAKADATSKLRPWLCLIVVRKQQGVTLSNPPGAALPQLQISSPAVPAVELPELRESWAWAHAQVAAADNSSTNVGNALVGAPEVSLSRLVCPRRLTANTDYIACVVPTFDFGRQAGLGVTVTDAMLNGTAGSYWAWSAASSPPLVLVPVYHHWEFRTGPGGDFLSLASKLKPQPMPAALGRRKIDISQPGFTPTTPIRAGTSVFVGGALQAAGRGSAPDSWPTGVASPFQTALAAIVNTPGQNAILDPHADPLLAPPLYGCWQRDKALVTTTGTTWFDQLNLDPRLRTVAAFGTHVVQEHQETLMASAWDQAAELEKGNQRMRQMQLSLAASESIHKRHLSRLKDDATLRFAAPAFARLRAVAAGDPVKRTLLYRMADARVPLPAMGATMRRIGRGRGPITRRVAAQGFARAGDATWITSLNTVGIAPHIVPSVGGTVGGTTVTLRPYESVTAAAVNAEPKKAFWIYPEGQVPAQWPFLPFDNQPWPYDDDSAHDFRLAAAAHLARIDPARVPVVPPANTRAIVLADASKQIRDLTLPQPALAALAATVVSLGDIAHQIPAPGVAAVGLESIMVAPHFPQPMYETLRDLSPDLVLPGLDAVLPDSVVGLETNRRFVEAYMVGLNFEMGRELLWRGFPTDQRGTYFDQFWGVQGADASHPDITPIHLWGDRSLGSASGAPQREQFVMLMRSSLLRRYPNAIIYLTPAILKNGVRVPSEVLADEKPPVFSGSMPPDVSFVGFAVTPDQARGTGGQLGYYVVIQEHPTEPRFGFPDGVAAGTSSHVVIKNGPPSGLQFPGLTWGLNAAQMAGISRRLPVRLAIHASQLINQ